MTFDTFYNKILQETTILEFPSQKYKQVNSSFFFGDNIRKLHRII